MFRRLESNVWKKVFLNEFKYYAGFDIPVSYVEYDDVWAYIVDGKIKGGFALVTNSPHNCRLFQQIKDPEKRLQANYYWSDVTEITAYFIGEKKCTLPIKWGMVLRCLRHPCKQFFYSYEDHKTKLSDYYALGKPKVYYRGPVIQLEGMPDNPKDESIEYLTKLGIIRIFVLSTLKQIKRRIRKLWQR